jgi:hypothetical protein
MSTEEFYTEDGALQVDMMPTPGIGQHNEEVYTSLLGYSAAELDQWHTEGAI